MCCWTSPRTIWKANRHRQDEHDDAGPKKAQEHTGFQAGLVCGPGIGGEPANALQIIWGPNHLGRIGMGQDRAALISELRERRADGRTFGCGPGWRAKGSRQR